MTPLRPRPDGRTTGISPSRVGRIRADSGLKPHITKELKLSNGPMFEEKVSEIVGLSLDLPDAPWFCGSTRNRKFWRSPGRSLG